MGGLGEGREHYAGVIAPEWGFYATQGFIN